MVGQWAGGPQWSSKNSRTPSGGSEGGCRGRSSDSTIKTEVKRKYNFCKTEFLSEMSQCQRFNGSVFLQDRETDKTFVPVPAVQSQYFFGRRHGACCRRRRF